MGRVRTLLVIGAVSAACSFDSTTDASPSGSAASTGQDASTGPPPSSDSSVDPVTSGAVVTSDGTSSTGADVTTGADGSSSGASSSGDPGPFVLCDATDPDLRACYDFVGAASGVLTDLSSYGNDGVVDPGVMVQAGPFGESVRAGPSASIIVDDDPSLDFPSTAITMDAWVRIDSRPAFGERAAVFDNDGQYSIFLYEGLGMRCGFGDRTPYGPLPPLGVWVHLACAGSASGTRVYIDGVEVATGGAASTGDLANAFPLVIADNSPQLDGLLDGEVAALRIFSRELSPAEVAEAAAAR